MDCNSDGSRETIKTHLAVGESKRLIGGIGYLKKSSEKSQLKPPHFWPSNTSANKQARPPHGGTAAHRDPAGTWDLVWTTGTALWPRASQGTLHHRG